MKSWALFVALIVFALCILSLGARPVHARSPGIPITLPERGSRAGRPPRESVALVNRDRVKNNIHPIERRLQQPAHHGRAGQHVECDLNDRSTLPGGDEAAGRQEIAEQAAQQREHGANHAIHGRVPFSNSPHGPGHEESYSHRHEADLEVRGHGDASPHDRAKDRGDSATQHGAEKIRLES